MSKIEKLIKRIESRPGMYVGKPSLEAIFNVINGYLYNNIETCESLGRKPEKAFKGQFNVRIDPALHKELAYHAVRDNCSLNQYVENALRKAVEKEEDR